MYLNLQNLQEAPSYTSFDMLVGYNSGNVLLALNAYNLTDKLYYSQVNGGRVVPAAGRSFIANLLELSYCLAAPKKLVKQLQNR